jgi:Na+/H+ antiporter NhaA
MLMTDTDITTLSEAILKVVSERMASETVYSKWLTVSEAMRYAEVKSRKTILAWINEGYIYAFRRTGGWIIDRESIDNWYNKDRF